MSRMLNAAILTLSLAGLVACGGGDGKEGGGKKDGAAKTDDGGKKDSGAAKTAYKKADHTGVVKGVLKLDGKAPEGKMLAIAGDDYCMGAHADGMADPRYVVGEGGVLPNGFVFATKGPFENFSYTPDQSPTKGFEVDQKGCMYTPHVFGVMVGQEFAVANTDETQHNVHVKPKRNKEENHSQDGGKKDMLKFTSEEKAIPFACDIHSWMSAYAFALDHPFFAATDATGAFEISGLPEGEYEFVGWHENFGKVTAKVTVKKGETATVEMKLTGK